MSGSAPVWGIDAVNPFVKEAEYAVRGAIQDRAEQLKQLLAGGEQLPFDKVVPCNIGNPQALGQQPIRFARQVLSLVVSPELLEQNPFPADVNARARQYIAAAPTGAYSGSQGVALVRQEVADFITARDQAGPADPEQIFLTDGASAGVKLVMQAFAMPGVATLVPVPQYPIYSAVSALYGSAMVPYYLSEDKSWGLNMAHVKEQLETARKEGKQVRALVAINPGNPTGQSLVASELKALARFCAEERLVLLADEVYQENIYGDAPKFCSARKACLELLAEGVRVELVSFHSISKGFTGECGLRGGYLELLHIDPLVKAQLTKLASLTLCANLLGQWSVGLMVHPPEPGQPSRAQYEQERDAIMVSLARRANKVHAVLAGLEGVSVNPPDGAMYLFPQITLPQGAVDAATEQKMAPDALYCLELLEATGLAAVPGSGFGQVDGTFHFRTTFLPPEDAIDQVLTRLSTFHSSFLQKYN